MHVLQVECSAYERAIASGERDLLAGCRCARCGGDRLELTGSKVRRSLALLSGERRLEVALARCLGCRARERVLPVEALPGKVAGVCLVVTAAQEVAQGKSQRKVARNLGVSRQRIAGWRRGLAQREQDLYPLWRHRARPAPDRTPAEARLVRWQAFAAEAQRSVGGPSRRLGLLELVSALGGPLETARLGARWFRQAVLLVRADRGAAIEDWIAAEPALRCRGRHPVLGVQEHAPVACRAQVHRALLLARRRTDRGVR